MATPPVPGRRVTLHDPLDRHETVAVLGLGATGRAACRLAHRLGKRVIAADRNADLDPAPFAGIATVHPGTHEIDDATAVILSPALNPEWPENRAHPELGPIYDRSDAGELALVSEVDAACAAFARPFVSVGGTDGKSTTAALAAALVRATGADTILGGNSWPPMSARVLEQPDATGAIVEISAFQLWPGHTIRPTAAILTNIADDHLDHYATQDDYVAAKLRILDHLGDGLFVPWQGDARLAAAADAFAASGGRVARVDGAPGNEAGYARDTGETIEAHLDGRTLAVPRDALVLPGAHNRRNLQAALLATLALVDGPIDAGAIADAVRGFHGLDHRVQFVRERDGVRFYDDSKATNVHAAVIGLRALERPVVAVVGGVDKGLELDDLVTALGDVARHVVLIGALADRLGARLDGVVTWEVATSMDDAARRAAAAARSGDAVTLAPAASSFDWFSGFAERGRVWQAAVRALS